MNLDTKLVVTILGQDFDLCCDLFWISHPFSLLSSLAPGDQVFWYFFYSLVFYSMLSPCTHMKRTASQAFPDPEPPILNPQLQVALYIALNPMQFQALLDLLPGPYSSRFASDRTQSRPWRGPTTSWTGALLMTTRLHSIRSRSSWSARSISLL